MTDIISLVCPSCGGKLDVASNTTTLVCQHCGNEHLVRREQGSVTLEAFARCPNCGRNDKVEKVTAILASQTHEVKGIETRTEVVVGTEGQGHLQAREALYSRTQVSLLVQRLSPPERPPTPPAKLGGSGKGWLVPAVGGTILAAIAVLFGLLLLCSLGLIIFDTAPREAIELVGLVY